MTVAYLHGFAGGPRVWGDIASPGAIVPALPGHGDVPVGATWADNLALVAASLAGADTVVGYSLGARIALGLYATGRVRRAVLISVNPGIPDAEKPARRAADATWAALLRAEGTEAFAERWEAQALFATQHRAAPERLARRHDVRRALDPEQLARCLETTGLAEMPDYTASVDDGCTLIVGADDAKFRAIATRLPARCHVLAACGHDPTLEQPDALAATLADLLA